MASVVDIILNAKWRGARATQSAERDLREMNNAASKSSKELQGVGESSKKTGGSVTSLARTLGVVAAAFGGAVLAGRKLFRMLEEGAGLELTRKRFGNLAREIGTTSDVLEDDLLAATDGMLSSTQSMSLATDLLALNLATNSDEAVRLARIVTELDQDLNQLTQAMANQSTRRLDQLGISVVTFREKLEALSDTMTDEEAYRIAFIQAAEEQIDRVGGVSESSAGDIRRLQAAMAEADEQFKLAFTKDVADRIGDVGDESAIGTRKMSIFGRELGERVVPAAINASRVAFPGLIEALKDLDRELERQALQEAEKGLSETAEAAAAAEDALRSAMSDGQVTREEYLEATKEIIDAEERLEEILQRVNVALDTRAEALSAIEGFEGRREGIDASDFAAEQRQAELQADFDLRSDRIQLWQDFQSDLTSITEQEQARRAEIEQQFESRRTELIEDFNERRAEAAADLEGDIADVREDSAERRADLQADAAERLEDLERDHARRRQRIIEDANAQLEDAASRLDAGAVSRIKRQRDRALEREEQQYEDQRQEIQETLQERLQEELEAEQERIADLREHHQDWLDQQQEAHEDRLEALQEQEDERLEQMRNDARERRRQREQQYIDERRRLGENWNARLVLERDKWNELLEEEEAFWDDRIALVGGDGTGGTGGTGTGTGTGDNRPTAQQVMQMAINQMQQAGWSPQAVADQVSAMQFWSTQRIAEWIEDNFDFDVPGYQLGTPFVPETGLAMLHRGEMVLNAQAAEALRTGINAAPPVSSVRNASMGDVNIHINGAQQPQDTAREVRSEMAKLFRELQ